MRRRIAAVAALSWILAGYGSIASAAPSFASAAPSFQEARGWVDSQCVATASPGQISCDVHVIIANKGGKGSGYASVAVPLTQASGGTARPASCLVAIPVIASGDYAEATCSVVMDKGMTVAASPQLQSLTAGAESDPANDPSPLLTILIVVVVISTLAVLWMAFQLSAVARRLSKGGPLPTSEPPVHSNSNVEAFQPGSSATRRAERETEFPIPPLPR